MVRTTRRSIVMKMILTMLGFLEGRKTSATPDMESSNTAVATHSKQNVTQSISPTTTTRITRGHNRTKRQGGDNTRERGGFVGIVVATA